MAVNRKSDITAEIIPEEKGLEETKVRVIIPLKEDDGSGLHNDQTECVIINGNTTLIKRGEYVDVSVPVFVQLKQRYPNI